MEGCHVSRWWTCFWTIVSWRLCKIFRVCLTVFCCVHVRCILRCRSAGPLFRGAARLEFCLNPKGERSTFVWEHVALNPRVFFLGCDLFVVLLVFFVCVFAFAFFSSWFCLGFALAFVVEECGGGLLVRDCAGQSRRVFFVSFFFVSGFCAF